MQIIITSLNPVKIGAVEDACGRFWPDLRCEFIGCSVPSGVPEQPLGDDETWQGAHNRVMAAKIEQPTADFWVGIEGGIDTLHSQVSTFAWVVVHHSDGRVSQSRSTSLPLPKLVTELIDQGLELGHACDRLCNMQNAKQKSGAIGLLTRELYSRRSTYTQAVVFALAAFDD